MRKGKELGKSLSIRVKEGKEKRGLIEEGRKKNREIFKHKGEGREGKT